MLTSPSAETAPVKKHGHARIATGPLTRDSALADGGLGTEATSRIIIGGTVANWPLVESVGTGALEGRRRSRGNSLLRGRRRG